MEKKEEKHRHLMEALRHSRDKKKGAMQLKLEEAEHQCQCLTKSSFEECQPCLEDTCKAFFTSTCRRGFASFSYKVETFFREMTAQLDATERVYNQEEEPEKQLPEDGADVELLQADASFIQLLSNTTVADVFEEIQEAETYFLQPGAGRLSALGQPQSRHLCRQLRRQASECLQLQSVCETCEDYLSQECQQLHSETQEMHMLLNASRPQYDDTLQLVRTHAADTQRWISNVEDEYGWVGQLAAGTESPHGFFSVIAVRAQQQLQDLRPRAGSSVVVTVLDSGPVTVPVPPELQVDEPAFIQYVAQEALTLYKLQIRGIDPSSVVS